MSLRTAAALTALLAAGAGSPAAAQVQKSDSAAVAEVVDKFHEALKVGDPATVEMLLHARAVILESGGVETREQYLEGHMRGDMAFAQAVPRQRGDIRVTLADNTAWAVSTSTTTGRYRDRDVDSQGAELMVLVKEKDQWKITAIHWSSRARRR